MNSNKTSVTHVPASPEQIQAARAQYASDDIEVDDNAGISDPEDGSGYWVQAWVWIDSSHNEGEG